MASATALVLRLLQRGCVWRWLFRTPNPLSHRGSRRLRGRGGAVGYRAASAGASRGHPPPAGVAIRPGL